MSVYGCFAQVSRVEPYNSAVRLSVSERRGLHNPGDVSMLPCAVTQDVDWQPSMSLYRLLFGAA